MIRRFSTDGSGSIAVQFGLAATVLVMFAGGAIDYAMLSKARGDLQAVTDTVALRLAALPREDRGATAAGLAALGLDRADALISIADDGGRVTVNGRRTFVPAFMKIAGFAEIEVSARAVAESVGVKTEATAPGSGESGKLTTCILALNRFASGAVSFGGNTTFNAPNCVVQANSLHASAIERRGSATANAAAFCAQGGIVGISQNVHSDCFVDDPYAGVPKPVIGQCAAVTSVDSGEAAYFRAGTYCAPLEIRGTATFEKGVYVLRQGMQINAQAQVRGEGVIFYLTGDPSGTIDATFHINGGADVRLSAPVDGHYEGLLLVQDRTASPGAENRLNGNSGTYLRGAIYTPTQRIRINGTGDFGSLTDHMPVVADLIEFSGNSRANANASAYDGAYRLPVFSGSGFEAQEDVTTPASNLPMQVRLVE